MGNNIVIKKIVKYSDYEFISFNKDLKLIGIDNQNISEYKSISSEQLVKDTYELGKNINKAIESYLKKIQSENINIVKHEKWLDYLPNKKVLQTLEEFCNIKDKEWSHYKAMHDFYENSYNLLIKEHIDVSKLMEPNKLQDYILSYNNRKLGIYLDNNYKDLDCIENCYKELLNILKNKNLNLKKLLINLNEVPLNFKHFNNLIDIFLTNKKSKEYELTMVLFDKIKKYCKKYGMPFWTDREDIAEIIIKKIDQNYTNIVTQKNNNETKPLYNSHYDMCNNTIPIHNLLYISLMIYYYTDLINDLLTKNDFDINLEEYKYKSKMLDIPFELSNNKNKFLQELYKKSEIVDDYIQVNCNAIYDFPLKVFRHKEYGKMKSHLTKYVYESVAFAAWDSFYLNYFGYNNIKNPNPHCDSCGIKLPMEKKKRHKTRDDFPKLLCDNCYKLHSNKKNADRVEKCRNKST